MADVLAVAIAVSLPWSTSATAILVGLWFFTLVPVLRWDELRREILTPAGGLPVLLVLLGVAGMLWADVTLLERWKGLDSFLKLLAIPLLLVQFRRSEHGSWVFAGYLLSCVALLVVTGIVIGVPPLAATFLHFDNVIVKNAATQSGEFVICIFGLLYLMMGSSERKRWPWVACLRGNRPRHACEYLLFLDRPHRACHDFCSVRPACTQDPRCKDDCEAARRIDRSRNHRLDVFAVLARAHRGGSRPKRRYTKRQTNETQPANGWNSGRNRPSSYGRRR